MESGPLLFGKLSDGTEVYEYTLDNRRGVVAKILTYGGIIKELWTPDRESRPGDIVLGFPTLPSYIVKNPYFGTLTGRVANRIAKGKFTLEGKSYALATNNGLNHLHGGNKGFDKVVWKVESFKQNDSDASLTLSYISPDGEEGYPGTLKVRVIYQVTHGDELSIEYFAETSKTTPVNLTSHSYFNLAGEGNVHNHTLQLFSEAYTPIDETLIPTGEIKAVTDTPFDFQHPKKIGEALKKLGGGGFDHNFIVKKGKDSPAPVARVEEPTSGRVMEVFSTEPGVQFYTGNFLDGSLKGKLGVLYEKHFGFCLETQHYPDAVNQPSFPSIILEPGSQFHSKTVHKFSVAK